MALSGLESTSMEGEYSQDWAELRRLRRRVRTIASAGATVLIVEILTRKYASHGIVATAFDFALIAAWFVIFIRLAYLHGEYVDWSCPRCGKPFNTTLHVGIVRWNRAFARRCVHCGCRSGWTPTPTPG